MLIENVYPGIDWKLYIDGSKFKYDFIVRKGADASLIKLKYIGAVGLLKDADGNIEVSTPFGSFKENRPYSYEDDSKREINSEYQINGNHISFKTGTCSGTMVIDPEIEWCTYYGGLFEDRPYPC